MFARFKSNKSTTKSASSAKPAKTKRRDPYFVFRLVFGSDLNKMNVARFLQPSETIMFGFRHTWEDRMEYAFTNLGLLWHTKTMERHDFGHLDYAHNVLGTFRMTKIGQIGRAMYQTCNAGEECCLSFEMGTKSFDIPLWRKAIELVWVIKYLRVFQAVQQEQLKQKELQAFVATVCGSRNAQLPGFELRQCYQQVILDAMDSFSMKPPADEAIDRDGRLLHTDGDLISVYTGTERTRVHYSHNYGIYLYNDLASQNQTY